MMYTRHFAPEPREEEFRLPDNYAGNAFSSEAASAEDEKAPVADTAAEPKETGSEGAAPPERETPLFRMDSMLSPDLLLVLLAFLLMGEHGNSELSSLLLYLLLIDGSKE